MERCVWLIAGPTASGKSALALALAEASGGEIVNADSMQIYADLRVLTARPNETDLARAPHHLYGVADAAEGWSVGRWLRAATETLSVLKEKDRPAIVVGGTGLYFRALTQGLADIPDIPASIRANAQAVWDEGGEPVVRMALRSGDPISEARIAAGDRQRLLRAWAVLLHTGRTLADWRAETSPVLPAGSWRGVVIEPDRVALYARCDARMEVIAASGGVEEARALLARDLDPDLPILKAVGVRSFGRFLAGEIALGAALAEAQQATRNYAKRQLTWFRHQTSDWPRVIALDPDVALAQIRSAHY